MIYAFRAHDPGAGAQEGTRVFFLLFGLFCSFVVGSLKDEPGRRVSE